MTILEEDPFHSYETRYIIQELNCKRFYRIEVIPGTVRASGHTGPWAELGVACGVMADHFSSLVDVLEEANMIVPHQETERVQRSCLGV